jgi:hypothetical protein
MLTLLAALHTEVLTLFSALHTEMLGDERERDDIHRVAVPCGSVGAAAGACATPPAPRTMGTPLQWVQLIVDAGAGVVRLDSQRVRYVDGPVVSAVELDDWRVVLRVSSACL